MKRIPNDIVLRPSFQLDLYGTKERVLESLEKSEVEPFLIKRIDEHIYIKFNSKENHFWSPQLHLEIETTDEENSKLYGVFGPNPTLWTFFMFIHFGVATFFIILSMWAYSSASLEKPYGLQIGLMVLMVLLWIIFYVFGRMGRRKGRPQMEQLYRFMMRVLTKE